MKQLLAICCSLIYVFSFSACDGGSSQSSVHLTDSMAPREATDPVPEPPTLPDTAQAPAQTAAMNKQEVLYKISGTEPFWSLSIGPPYNTYRSMAGDSSSFPYTKPQSAAGRPADRTQLFMLGEKGWVLLRKGQPSCSDGMSDREYEYTATLSLNGQLLDGCGQSN